MNLLEVSFWSLCTGRWYLLDKEKFMAIGSCRCILCGLHKTFSFSPFLPLFFFFLLLLKGSNILQNFLVWWCYSESINETSCYTKDAEQFYFIIGWRKWPHFAFPALTVVFGFQSLHQYKVRVKRDTACSEETWKLPIR